MKAKKHPGTVSFDDFVNVVSFSSFFLNVVYLFLPPAFLNALEVIKIIIYEKSSNNIFSSHINF